MAVDLQGCLYLSAATLLFERSGLQSLVDASATANREAGITGYLFYRNRKFVQYVEGPKRKLIYLIEQISVDPRHQIKYKIFDESITSRRFPKWHMRLLEEAAQQVELEHVLEGHLAFAARMEKLVTPQESRTWQMVDRLSEIAAVKFG